jgi:PhnB protein
MKNAIQPYLHFDEKCEEAMKHYQQLFGGELEIMPIGESPAKDQFPPEIHHQILHASLSNGEFKFMASDMCGMGVLTPGNAVQLSLDCDSMEEIETLFKQLSDGGQVIQKLEKQFWGSLFAMVVDKYGVRWMLSLDQN